MLSYISDEACIDTVCNIDLVCSDTIWIIALSGHILLVMSPCHAKKDLAHRMLALS